MRLTLLFFFAISLQAKLLLSPFDAMKANFGDDVEIVKKNILLSNNQAKALVEQAQTKIDTKIYRIFHAKKDGNILGYGILVLHKVRSNKTAILSIITPDGVLKCIEVIAFNEPMEYIPSANWIKVLENQTLSPRLNLGKDIPTVTGSTLSARAATKAARIALALFNVKYKQ
jgi:electron transport complex protein RnfG